MAVIIIRATLLSSTIKIRFDIIYYSPSEFTPLQQSKDLYQANLFLKAKKESDLFLQTTDLFFFFLPMK